MNYQELPFTSSAPTYFKYKSTKDLIHFIDILLHNRLYASSYPKLNDPMEGHYYYESSQLQPEVRQRIRGEKEGLRVCCLSEKYDDPLMWAHYADGHRGVMIEVEICGEQPFPVSYRKNLPKGLKGREPIEVAKEVLSCKLKAWSYEDEYRVFSTEGCYILVNVRKIVLGSRMPNDERKLIKALVPRLNETVNVCDSEIGIIERSSSLTRCQTKRLHSC